MKYTLLFIVSLSFLMNSCTIEKRRYTSGYHVDWRRHPKLERVVSPNDEPPMPPSDASAAHDNKDIVYLNPEISDVTNDKYHGGPTLADGIDLNSDVHTRESTKGLHGNSTEIKDLRINTPRDTTVIPDPGKPIKKKLYPTTIPALVLAVGACFLPLEIAIGIFLIAAALGLIALYHLYKSPDLYKGYILIGIGLTISLGVLAVVLLVSSVTTLCIAC